jgi:hypothetical protein
MATRSRTQFGAKGLIACVLAVSAFVGPLGRATPARPAIRVDGADQGQRNMVEWAIKRYRAAGLAVPPVEIDFHSAGGEAPCSEGGGFYRDGRIDLCTGISVNAFARKVTLHEMAHLWADRNMSAEDERAFLELRGLRTWNDWHIPWAERGSEQVAEIISWGIGEGLFTPLIPDNSPEELAAAFTVLTGQPPLVRQPEA